jgi:hypothetical protein
MRVLAVLVSDGFGDDLEKVLQQEARQRRQTVSSWVGISALFSSEAGSLNTVLADCSWKAFVKKTGI